MAELHDEITAWLHDQPNWLQEAADRLLTKEDLGNSDIDELTELLKTKDGQIKSDHRKFTGLSQKSAANKEVRLNSIGEIKGIEKLAPRTPLSFGKGNLSVIYGHNGSGKSGYARIIKKVCGKPRAEELKPNVFEDPPQEQKCTIEYQVADHEMAIDWHTHNGTIEDLEVVDIFDWDEAGFYLNKETEVSYTPPEVALFENLAQVCDRVKQNLQVQQNKLVSKLPNLPSQYKETEIAKNYQNLKADQSQEEINKLVNWSESDQEKFNQINERLNTADPSRLATGKQKKKQQLDENIITRIKKTLELVNKEGCRQIQELKTTAAEKRKVATEGAQAQTSSAKLEGIGTDTWNALWEAARKYSQEIAYPDQEFPVTDEGARCVLCHQKLDSYPEEQAKKRLKDFENYVQGKLEKNAKEAEQKLKTAIEKLPEVPSEDGLRTACEASGLEEEWFTGLNEFWQQVQEVSKSLKDIDFTDSLEGIQDSSELLKNLEKRSECLQNQIDQHNEDAKGYDTEKINQQKLELEAKKWTSQQKGAIENEIKRLKYYNNYEYWEKKASSRSISSKAGEISKKAITEEYINRFNEELKALGAERIQVELVKTGSPKGQPKHQIKLCNVQHGNPKLTEVLSDGERRIVALAAFLADVSGRPQPAPFVFDDPISSLDHDFEWEVAMRLATLAQARQVIVLTHRLSLYGVLEEAEKKIRGEGEKYIEQRCIESFGGAAGQPADEQAWVQNTRKANDTLLLRLNEAKKYWDGGKSTNFKIHAQSICSDFRKLLERTVEDDLLNEVVKRHRRSVMTDKKLNKLTNIKNEDAEFLDQLMTKYSKFEHSQSKEIPVEVPGEPELRKDLEALKEWRKNFKDRDKSDNK